MIPAKTILAAVVSIKTQGDSSLNVTCPLGYQAFHTFHGPISQTNYPEVDCVKYENSACVQECYWSGARANRTRGDCFHWLDIKAYGNNTFYQGKKAVYVSGLQFDKDKGIKMTYCCISKASVTGTCQKKIIYSTLNGSKIFTVNTVFSAMANPIVRSMDCKDHSDTFFDYVLEVCSTAHVSLNGEAQCSGTSVTETPSPTSAAATTATDLCIVAIPDGDKVKLFGNSAISSCSDNKCTFQSGETATIVPESNTNKCNEDTVRIVYSCSGNKSCLFYEVEGDGDNDNAIRGDNSGVIITCTNGVLSGSLGIKGGAGRIYLDGISDIQCDNTPAGNVGPPCF